MSVDAPDPKTFCALWHLREACRCPRSERHICEHGQSHAEYTRETLSEAEPLDGKETHAPAR